MKLKGILLIGYCLMCGAGCSVKEDRMECPCRLILDLSGVDTAMVEEADLYVSTSRGFILNDTLDILNLGKEYELSIPKGKTGVWVYGGADGYDQGPEGLKIPYGEDCPEIFMHMDSFDASDEQYHEKVLLRKNHCVLTIYLHAEIDLDFDVAITGEVDGYDSEGNPSKGDFRYELSFEGDSVARAILPRQEDASLRLEILDSDQTVRVFSLGEYIESSGYDWGSDNLENITMMLDYALSSIGFSIEDWEEEYHFDVVI